MPNGLTTKLLLEPVVISPTWHKTYAPEVRAGLLGVSLVPTEFEIRVTHESGPKLDHLLVQYIKVVHGNDVEDIPSPGQLPWPAEDDTLTLGPFTTTFPTAGLYYVQADVAYTSADHQLERFETLQRLPHGAKGRGWSDEQFKHKWRNPIVVMNHGTAAQLRLSRQVVRLTWALALLTLALVADGAIRNWPAISSWLVQTEARRDTSRSEQSRPQRGNEDSPRPGSASGSPLRYSPELVPDTIMLERSSRAVWRAAHALVGPDGELHDSTPAWVTEGSPGADRGCIPQVLIKDIWDADNSWPRDLPELVERARTILFGTVAEVVPGFRFNREHGEAGTMLAVRINERLVPDAEYASDTLLVFYPAGRFQLGGVEVCRLATSAMPDPPAVGDRIMVAPRRSPVIADPAVFEPLVTGPEILYEAATGQLAVARGLAGLREVDGDLDFDELRNEIRRLAGG